MNLPVCEEVEAMIRQHLKGCATCRAGVFTLHKKYPFLAFVISENDLKNMLEGFANGKHEASQS